MAIDNSIYGQSQAPDLLGNIQKGLSISNSMKDQKRQEQESLAQQQAAQQKALAEQKQKEVQLLARSGRGVKDQAGYDSLLKTAKFMGHDISELPPQWGPDAQGMIASLASNELGVDKQIGIETDAKQFDYAKIKDNRNFANQDRAFNLDKTDKNRDYEMKLANMGLTREQFEEQKNQNSFGNNLKAKELALMERDKSAMQKYREAMLAKNGAASSGEATGSDPGLEVPGVGIALTKTDANTMKDASTMKQKFDRQIGELIGLRKEFGNEAWNKDAVGRGEQLSKDLLLTYKNLAKLGVLSKSDENIINEIIPTSPLSMEGLGITDTFNMIKGQDPKLTKLEGFQKDMNEDYANNVATRIRGGNALANNMRGEFRNQGPAQDGGGFINEAQASGAAFDNVLKAAPNMGPQDQSAFQWASQNSQDPRAQKILMNLNSKYGGR